MKRNETFTNELPEFLFNLNFCISNSLNIKIESCFLEKESSEYNASYFKLAGKHVIFRSAKITPKKNGLFVTLWKRDKDGRTIPYNAKDKFDKIIIEVKRSNKIGYFIFEKEILIKKSILSYVNEGKRGFRIYPPWEKVSNKQALNTQMWQIEYFLEEINNRFDNRHLLNKLLNFD